MQEANQKEKNLSKLPLKGAWSQHFELFWHMQITLKSETTRMVKVEED